MGLRPCRKCGVEFDGVRCGSCEKAWKASYYSKNRPDILEKSKTYYRDNRDLILERSAAYRASHADVITERKSRYYQENSDVLKARASEYYAANAAVKIAYGISYYAKNADKIKQQKVVYNALNQEKRRVYYHNRQARIRIVGGKLSADLSSRLFVLQKGMCACCGASLGDDYQLDHIIPIALGGANEDWNIQLLTKKCNSSKRAKHPIDFMQSKGKLL